MATFRAASLVSVTELEKLVNRLTEQSQIAESQRAQLAMRLSANNRDEETQRLLARTELGLRDVKTALRELEGEKEKLVAAREAAKQAKDLEDWALWRGWLVTNLKDSGKERTLGWIKRLGFKPPKRLTNHITD